MSGYEYPGMRYRLDNREVWTIVHDEDQDRALGEGWTDPAGVRADPPSVETVTEASPEAPPVVKESLTVEPRKPGRPRKEAK